MASPFDIFRRNQRIILIAVTLMAMIAFVFMDRVGGRSVDPRSGAGMVAVTSPVIGKVTEAQIGEWLSQRSVATDFMMAAFLEVNSDNPIARFIAQQQLPGLFYLGQPTQRLDVVLGHALRTEAATLGISIDVEQAKSFIQDIASNKLTGAQFSKLVRERNLSEVQLIDIIRNEMQSQQMLRLLLPTMAGNGSGAAFASPEMAWLAYQRLNTQQRVGLAAVPVKDFYSLLAEPAEPDLKKLFEEYKGRPPVDFVANKPQIGFKLPQRIRIHALRIRGEDMEARVQASNPVTDEQVAAYYEQNKETKYRERSLIDAPSDPSMFGPDFPSLDAPAGTNPPALPAPELPANDAATTPPATTDGSATGDKTPAGETPAADPKATEPATGEAPAVSPPEPAAGESTTPPEKAAGEPGTDNPDAKGEPSNPPGNALSSQTATGISPRMIVGVRSGDLLAQADAAQPPAEPATSEPATSEPATTEPAASGKSSEPAAPPVSGPAANGDPAAPPAPRYKPLDDDLQEQIRTELLRTRAEVELDKVSSELWDKVGEAGISVADRFSELDKTKLEDSADVVAAAKAEFERLAEATKTEFSESPLVSYAELRDSTGVGAADIWNLNSAFPGESFGQGDLSVSDAAFDSSTNILQPKRAGDSVRRDAYVFWIVQNQAEHIPTFDEEGVKGLVTKAWQLQTARPMASKRAEALAEIVRKSAESMTLSLKDQTITGVEGSIPLSVRETAEQFRWIESSVLPSGNPTQGRNVSLTKIIDKPSEEFLQKIFFDLQPGDVGIAGDLGEETFYVVKVIERQAASREKFLAAMDAGKQPAEAATTTRLLGEEGSKITREFYQQLMRRYAFTWTNEQDRKSMNQLYGAELVEEEG